MKCTPLTKAAKPVWTNQLIRLPCLVVCVKFQFVCTTTSQIGSQLLLTSTSSKVLLARGSEKAFNECLEVSNVFSSLTKAEKLICSIQLAMLCEFRQYTSCRRKFIFAKLTASP